MRRLIYLFCCLLLLTAIGCGRPPRPVNQIEVWHWMTDREEALESLARQYEQETGVKVKLELFAPSDSYTQKVTAASQANVLPDIYGILDKKSIMALFIKAGFVADLTSELTANNSEWKDGFFNKALEVSRFPEGNAYGVKPGYYGIPIDVTNIQLVYNRALLKKAGITNLPKTFEEFISAVESLKRVGVTPFVAGFGELWVLDCFAYNYAFNILGEEKVMDTFRGTVKYTDPDWIRVFTLFKTLADKGAFMEGTVTKGNKYAEQDFALERAAFSFDGSWVVNIYRSLNPKLDYGVIPLPVENQWAPMSIWGGAGSFFVVRETSPNKNKAIAFLKWLSAKEQQSYLSDKTINMPANREAAKKAYPAELSEFAQAMDRVTHPTVWPLNEDALVMEAFDKGLQAIIIGEKTPADVARDVQAIKVRELRKKAWKEQ